MLTPNSMDKYFSGSEFLFKPLNPHSKFTLTPNTDHHRGKQQYIYTYKYF